MEIEKFRSQQRLKMYQKYIKDFEDHLSATDSGFCYYFSDRFGINIYDPAYFKRLLPELYATKPKTNYRIKGRYTNYWYAEGSRERVKCIERAIELVKEKITSGYLS